MGSETLLRRLFVEAISFGTLSEDQVAQIDISHDPKDNLHTGWFYVRDGEILQKQQVPVRLTEYGAATTVSKAEWKITEEEEQPDIQDERGGALDEFLNDFKPQ